MHLLRTHHPLSPPVLLLVALEPDALCATRILTALLKRDYIPHKIQPVSGYGDLAYAGETLVQPMRTQQGGTGGIVICLGVGGLVDVSAVLGLESKDDSVDASGGVEIWIFDARRPWNLGNVFGGNPAEFMLAEVSGNARSRDTGVENGRIQQSYKPGQGGIIVYDNGDIDEELSAEKEAYCALAGMPEVDDDGGESDGSDTENEPGETANGTRPSKKRKSWSDHEEEDEENNDENGRSRQRRRSNSVWRWL